MRLDIPCKTGKIQLTDDGVLRIQAPFGKTVWQVPESSVTGFTVQAGIAASVVTIHTTQGSYQAEMVANRYVARIQACFPHLQANQAGKEWWHNPTALTHVETYTDQKRMQREVEAAGQFGWIPQTSAGVGSHINVGRTMTKFVLTGGIGLMTGASRSKDKITITFVRSQEWLNQQNKE